MILKVKPLKFSAGKPVTIISKETSIRLNVHIGERIKIKRTSRKKGALKEIISVVDIATSMLKEDEIVVSSEIAGRLKLKDHEKVRVEAALKPVSTRFILKKLRGEELNYTEIFSIIHDIVNNAVTETEIAYFVSGMYNFGMNDKEIINLIKAMVKTGKILKIKRKKVFDKHSIGGIAGNRTTPIIISICAAAGLTMPKTSSRSITSAAGTADVMETLCNVELNIAEIKKIVSKTNACIVWGGSLGVAPADDKIIRVERILSLDPESQLIASILAKKVSAGITHFLLDIPYGKGAKVSEQKARKLTKRFRKISKLLGIKTEIVLTDGEQPIGRGIGPALEMKDIFSILIREESRAMDLEDKAIMLSGMLLEMSGKAEYGKGKEMALFILNSGKALEKFKQIVKAQGGNLKNINKKLTVAKYNKKIRAEKRGRIVEINNRKMNFIARIVGCPANKGAGIYLHKKVGDFVKKKETIATIYSEDKSELEFALQTFKKAKAIKIQ
jgi:putative thymidine phosphorylase